MFSPGRGTPCRYRWLLTEHASSNPTHFSRFTFVDNAGMLKKTAVPRRTKSGLLARYLGQDVVVLQEG
jgi:hypothetical protein